MQLELLAPAKNKDVGIAAINCGADAVYIAGPAYGARESAANTYKEIEELCIYAHKFGAKIYMVINTILYDNELKSAQEQIHTAYKIGCDAIIVQDLAVLKMDLPPIELHASTQTNIRTPEQAKFLESLGFTRLILARELSLEQIKGIKNSVSSEIETFVHGALCVSYSGQCYLSEYLCSRSANRGSCIQACRANYDLTDKNGKIILKNSPILSLKDFNLSNKLEGLIDSGVISFKIEGRLKSASYVKNITRHYRLLLDKIIKKRNSSSNDNTLIKSSFGEIKGGFTPNPESTFNRAYTEFFIDGKRGHWNSGSSAKSTGELLGQISRIIQNDRDRCRFQIKFKNPNTKLSNGDGLFIKNSNSEFLGARADIVDNGNTVTSKPIPKLKEGASIYRNSNLNFEKELEKNTPSRLINAEIEFESGSDEIKICASAQNCASAIIKLPNNFETANNQELAKANIYKQLAKSAEEYNFNVTEVKGEKYPFIPLSSLNSIRRDLAIKLRENFLAISHKEHILQPANEIIPPAQKVKLNCSNILSKELYESIGIIPEAAYELSHKEDEELMRTKYCIRYELGYCPKEKNSKPSPQIPFYLLNNGQKLKVTFDCQNCEMIIKKG